MPTSLISECSNSVLHFGQMRIHFDTVTSTGDSQKAGEPRYVRYRTKRKLKRQSGPSGSSPEVPHCTDKIKPIC